MTEIVGTPGEIPGSHRPPPGQPSSQQFGLTAAMALIVGSIIGVGVFPYGFSALARSAAT
ncbi:MAG TPA: hypothetical protein VMK84_37115 [Streptosporangiaceae bacterium]|nr:hypothetical protein [Streptosporangiaceae bacterium]